MRAGGGQLVRRGRTRTLSNPRVVTSGDDGERRLVRSVARTFGHALVVDVGD
jgi:hypothetical protein